MSTVSQTRSAVLSERYIFHWSLVSIFACLFLAGFSSLAWLHDDVSARAKVAIEALCCAVLALDLYFHKRDLATVVRQTMLRVVTVLAVVPWYTLTTALATLPDESMMIFLAHASYAPYLYFRFRSYTREHIAPKVVRVSLVFVLSFFCLHWLASIWMVLQPNPAVDFATEYNRAMYFLMTTVATVGYGDIVPSDNVSRIYTMGLQVLGVCMFGVVIGQVSRLIIDADKRREHAQHQIDSLTSLFKHYKIPPALQKKAYRFLHHVLAHASNEDEERVLNALPKGLAAELRTYMVMQPISKVTLFQGCSEACLMEAAKELQQVYFSPEEVVIRKGDQGDVMFLIGHGQVEIHDGPRHIATLTDGQVFGEMALLGEDRRGADAKAITHCDVYVLTRERFQHLLKHHRDLQVNVDKVIDARRRVS